MEERDIEVRVGGLVIVAVAIFAAFLFVLGNFSLSSGYRLKVDFDFSGDLRPGAPVKVAGIRVGKVDDVSLWGGRLDEATGRRVQVRVVLWVEDRVRETIRADAEFFVSTTGLLGEKYVEIVPGSHTEPPLLPGAVVRGVDPPRTDLIIARAYEFLDAVTPVLRDNKDEIRRLLGDGAEALRHVNAVLLDNHEVIGRLLVSTERLADEGGMLVADVRGGLGGDPRVIGRTLGRLEGALASADVAMTTLTPRLATLADEGIRIGGALTDERVDGALVAVAGVGGITGRTEALLDEALGLVGGLRRGHGTAGQLLVRDELYADIREMVRDLRRHPWKLIWKE
jgi:phospholipid/cholesterol/gamma-HCH transport system substrate-binding protein